MTRPSAYSPAQKALHWITLLLMIALFGLALSEDLFARGPARDRIWFLHISFGLLLIVLVAGRLVLRATHGAPSLPGDFKPNERRLAAFGHWSLYGMLVAVMAAGVALASLRGDALDFFGLFTLPAPVPANRALGRQVKEVHEWLAYLVMAAAAGHGLVAVWHHYVRRDDVMSRMLPSRGP